MTDMNPHAGRGARRLGYALQLTCCLLWGVALVLHLSVGSHTPYALFLLALCMGVLGTGFLLHGESRLGAELLKVGVSFDNSWIVWGRRFGVIFVVSLVLCLLGDCAFCCFPLWCVLVAVCLLSFVAAGVAALVGDYKQYRESSAFLCLMSAVHGENVSADWERVFARLQTAPYAYRLTVTTWALEKHRYDLVRAMLDMWCPERCKPSDVAGTLPLLCICILRRLMSGVHFLVEYGISVNTYRCCPLALATAMGEDSIVQLLLKHGAALDSRRNPSGWMPLHYLAALYLHGQGENTLTTEVAIARAQKWLDEGADINARTRFGCTPLDLARSMDNPEFAVFLRSRGARWGESLSMPHPRFEFRALLRVSVDKALLQIIARRTGTRLVYTAGYSDTLEQRLNGLRPVEPSLAEAVALSTGWVSVVAEADGVRPISVAMQAVAALHELVENVPTLGIETSGSLLPESVALAAPDDDWACMALLIDPLRPDEYTSPSGIDYYVGITRNLWMFGWKEVMFGVPKECGRPGDMWRKWAPYIHTLLFAPELLVMEPALGVVVNRSVADYVPEYFKNPSDDHPPELFIAHVPDLDEENYVPFS